MDLCAFDDAGVPIPIQACRACDSWYAAVMREQDDVRVTIREWHAADCPHLLSLLAEDLRDGCH